MFVIVSCCLLDLACRLLAFCSAHGVVLWNLVKQFTALQDKKSDGPSEEDIKAFRALRGFAGPASELRDDSVQDWHKRGAFLVDFPSIGTTMSDPPQPTSRGRWLSMREVLDIVKPQQMPPVVFDGFFKGSPSLVVLWVLRFGTADNQVYHVRLR